MHSRRTAERRPSRTTGTVAHDDGQQGAAQQNRVQQQQQRKRYNSQHTRASCRDDRWAGWRMGSSERLRRPSDATAIIDRKGKSDSTAASEVEYTSSSNGASGGGDRIGSQRGRRGRGTESGNSGTGRLCTLPMHPRSHSSTHIDHSATEISVRGS